MGKKLRYYVILHLVVLVYGFTGILGDQINLPAEKITFFRVGISFFSLLVVGLFVRNQKPLTGKNIIQLILVGCIVGIHWYTFFHAIKVSNVSIALVCMASSPLFTSILEPIFFKRKFIASEFILGLTIIVGIAIIFGFEGQYYKGIFFGLTAAFLAALFTVLNGQLITKISSFSITKYEMLGALIMLSGVLFFSNQLEMRMFSIERFDWICLTSLGVVCTTIAFMVSVWVMKFVTPFTVSMSINMEPIYAIIIALIIDHYNGTTKEQMTSGFYFGAIIIITSIFLNGYLKKRVANKFDSQLLTKAGNNQ